MFKPCAVFIFLLTIYNLFLTSMIDSKLMTTNLTLCKGPKRKDCSINRARMINNTLLNYEMHLLQDITPDKGKITIFSNGKPLMRMQMKKPCDNIFFKSLIKLSPNIPPDCNFKKGNYSFNYNMEDIMRRGGMYYTGNMTTRVVFHTDDCNFSCTIIETEIYP